ncbi:MAG: hypothetical protein EAZ54_09980 [Curvibacter sp.]|nr:MAG: hypothetical protein EAZ54_09980 [Curvibacter sp.]
MDSLNLKTSQRLRSFGGSWLEGRNSHIRVRVAMYGVLLLLLVLGTLRAILAQQWQEDRQLDLDVFTSVSEQRLVTLQLGMRVESFRGRALSPSELEDFSPSAHRDCCL